MKESTEKKEILDNKKNNDKYYSLAPTSENDGENLESDSYVDALKWALQQKDIHNIALTGPLGSGKSSILCRLKKEAEKKTEKEEEKHIFLNISLAAFGNGNGDTEETDGDTKKICSTNVIARGILEQLFYSEDPKNIPLSRYKKLPTWKLKKFTIAVAAVYFLALLIFLFAIPDMFSKFISQCNDLSQLGVPAALIAVIFILIILGAFAVIDFLAWGIAKRCRGYKFAFKSGSGTAFVIEGDDEGNIFDKYLDEIIYFFEVTKYDVVIFEDVERFGNTEIFVQLRKLNELLQKDSGIKRDIRFIYAVRDGLFQTGDAEERTKFFDFIIPVVPYISNINSRDKLTEFFNKDEWKNAGIKISDDFIKDVSVKISSMRCLKNIMNEFALYFDILFKNHYYSQDGQDSQDSQDVKKYYYMDPEKLLALIIYKNLRPNEFEKLQERKGMIAVALSANGKEEIGDYIAEKNENESDWHSYSTKQLIDKIGYFNDSCLEIGDQPLRQDSLEYFMLQRGYIDESYPDYISYIYNVTIRPTDNDFIHAVKSFKNLPNGYKYKLNDIRRVIEDLSIHDFRSSAFFNYNLVMYLLEYTPEKEDDIEYGKKWNYAFATLTSQENEKSKDFLYDLWSFTERRGIFISSITKHWEGDGFWKYVSSYSKITDESREKIVTEMFQWAEPANIIKQSSDDQLNNSIKNFIEEKISKFTQRMQNAPIDTVKKVIEVLDIRFSKLEAEESDPLLEYIFKEDHYKLNTENVELVLRLFGKVPSNDINRKNYSSILGLEDSVSWFRDHIQKNLSGYISEIFLMLPDNTEESEDAVADICSSSELTLETKMKVIDKENIVISDISKFPEDLWNPFLEEGIKAKEEGKKGKLNATVKNITTFWDPYNEERKLLNKELLCKYMESYISEIIESLPMYDSDDKIKWAEMIREMAYSETFGLDLFKTCYESVKYPIQFKKDTIEINLVNGAGKLDYLIEKKAFNLTDTNYRNIKNKRNRNNKYYPHIKLLETWPEEYGNNINSGKYQVENDDLPAYLSSKIPTQYKLLYIKRKINANIRLNQETVSALADLMITCGNEGQTVDSSIYNKVLQSHNISNDKKAAVVNAVIKANNMTEKSQREEILKTAGLDYLLKSDYPADGSQEIKELWSLLHDNCENE